MGKPANSWETSKGRVTFEGGRYFLHPKDKDWMPPIALPTNAAVLCELPNEAIAAEHGLALGILGLIAGSGVGLGGLCVVYYWDGNWFIRFAAGAAGFLLCSLWLLPWSFARILPPRQPREGDPLDSVEIIAAATRLAFPSEFPQGKETSRRVVAYILEQSRQDIGRAVYAERMRCLSWTRLLDRLPVGPEAARLQTGVRDGSPAPGPTD